MEFHKKGAIFMQIVEMICEKILTRTWLEGDKIPSVRELAVSIEVNPNTIMRSYAYLQEKGIIQNKRGIGYFVAEHAHDDTLDLMKFNFIKNDLPLFFKTISLLNIDFEELKERFNKFEKGKEKDEDKQ
ncbi:MAG: GntR family transcriptional regulator [Deltaproteobacteria bacterium]|nr:GntR family transcriptional regulator [Deltaproteobacteria bacterium]